MGKTFACKSNVRGLCTANDRAVKMNFVCGLFKTHFLKMYPVTTILTLFPSVQGKAIGVGIGCILGMFPLMFFKDDDDKKEGQTEAEEKTQPPPASKESSKN